MTKIITYDTMGQDKERERRNMSDISSKTSGFGIGELGQVPENSNIVAEHARSARIDNSLVKCSCGHWVPRRLVMSASMGTCCFDCYDRMSD